MNRAALVPVLVLVGACRADRIAGVRVTHHQASFVATLATADSEAAHLAGCPDLLDLPASDWRETSLVTERGSIRVPPNWDRTAVALPGEIWNAADSTGGVFLQASSAMTSFEVSGAEGFEPVAGAARCSALLAGRPAPYRLRKFARHAPPPDTIYFAETEVLVARDRAFHAIAFGLSAQGFRRAMVVLARLHLLDLPAPVPN
jgi:hypothetical protein